MVHLLITRGAGFIGSNLCNYWFKDNPNDNLIILDKLTYAGNLNNLNSIINSSKRVNFIQGDICDKELIDSILRKFSISHILNLELVNLICDQIDKISNSHPVNPSRKLHL